MTYEGKGFNVKTGVDIKYDPVKGALAGTAIAAVGIAGPEIAGLAAVQRLATSITSLFF